MYTEYSLFALLLIVGLIAISAYSPIEFDWSVLDDEDVDDIDLDAASPKRTANQAKTGAATTSMV